MDIANALHEHIEVAQAYQEHANEIAQSGEIICHALQRGRKILGRTNQRTQNYRFDGGQR